MRIHSILKGQTAMKTNLTGLSFGLAIAAIIGYSPVASAAVFDLDVSDPSAGIGTPTVQGTVTLTQNGADEVDIVVALTSGVLFVNTGGPHTPFLFNLNSSVAGATVTVTSTNGNPGTFSPASGSQSGTPFGTFTDGIDMSGGNGASNGTPGPLDLSVVDASGITISDFVANANSAIFAADLLGTAGGTGTVASEGSIATTPLPGAFVLFGTVLFGGLGVSKWRKQRQRGPISVMA